MAPLRRDEQRAAAAIVGVHELHFLGYPDGRVEATLELRCDITRVIRTVRPNRVITQSPDRNWDRIYASHPDHLATGEATVARRVPRRPQPLGASRSSRPRASNRGPSTRSGWASGATAPTHYVDITTAVDRKIEALLSHKSQLPDPDATATMVRSWTGAIAQVAGLPEGRAAEAMRVVGTQ